MKKLFLLFALLGTAMAAKAQSPDYHAFKFDIGLGYAIPSSGGSGSGTTKAGATFTLQPHYRLSDDLAIGLRIEGAGLGYEDKGDGNTSAKVELLTSYCATAEYYLSNNTFRPFVGAGLGFFSQQSASVNSDNSSDNNGTLVAGGTKFGAFPEAGFEAGHFRFSVDYNVVGSNNSYLAFKIGAFFGGGSKK